LVLQVLFSRTFFSSPARLLCGPVLLPFWMSPPLLPIQFVVPLWWSVLRHFIRTGIYMPYEAVNVSVNPIQVLFSCCVETTSNEIQYIDRFFYLVLFGTFWFLWCWGGDGKAVAERCHEMSWQCGLSAAVEMCCGVRSCCRLYLVARVLQTSNQKRCHFLPSGFHLLTWLRAVQNR
jgi:hypothetical protein